MVLSFGFEPSSLHWLVGDDGATMFAHGRTGLTQWVKLPFETESRHSAFRRVKRALCPGKDPDRDHHDDSSSVYERQVGVDFVLTYCEDTKKNYCTSAVPC